MYLLKFAKSSKNLILKIIYYLTDDKSMINKKEKPMED